jgi:monofunctional biosynthetic peptidoglycan transglycosylase
VKKFKRYLLRSVLLLSLAWLVLGLLLVVPFRWINPPVTMVMLDRWLSSEGDDFYLHQQWLDWNVIPKQAALAVVTSEDQKFPHHAGIDFEAVMTALKEAYHGGDLRGASTISQQVAKNMYLWTGRSWLRKGLELWFTLLVELSWGKQRILEVYLNIAEWGPGIFGLEAASRYHFGKPAAQLTPMQSALLASSLPSPLNYQPAQPASHLIERANWNLAQQQKLGGTAWLGPLQ